MLIYLFFSLGKYLFIWRHQISFAESSIFSCSTQDLFFSYSMWDQVPLPGIKTRSPALGAWSLSHWTTREVPYIFLMSLIFHFLTEKDQSSK